MTAAKQREIAAQVVAKQREIEARCGEEVKRIQAKATAEVNKANHAWSLAQGRNDASSKAAKEADATAKKADEAAKKAEVALKTAQQEIGCAAMPLPHDIATRHCHIISYHIISCQIRCIA
jgi:hypothetical protein